MRAFFLHVLFLMGSLPCYLWARSNSSVQKITGSEVFMIFKGEKKSLSKGDSVPWSAVIQTGKNSSVLVMTTEGDLFHVYENSQMIFDQKKQESMKSIVLNLTKGSLRFLVRKLSKTKKDSSERVRVKTPAAVMGIRGTQGVIELINNHEVKLFVLSGLVRFLPLLSERKEKNLFVQRQQMVSFSKKRNQLTAPKRFKPQDLGSYLNEKDDSEEFKKDAVWVSPNSSIEKLEATPSNPGASVVVEETLDAFVDGEVEDQEIQEIIEKRQPIEDFEEKNAINEINMEPQGQEDNFVEEVKQIPPPPPVSDAVDVQIDVTIPDLP